MSALRCQRRWLTLALAPLLALGLVAPSGAVDPSNSGRARPPLAPVSSWGSGLNVLRVPTINRVQTGVLVMGAKPYRIVEQIESGCNGEAGINVRHRSLEQLLSRDCRFGPRCLAFEGFVAPSGCGPDRIELNVGSAKHDGLRYGETGYLRFFLRIDPALSGLQAPALISQTWQFASVAVGKRPALGPAFSIAIKSNDGDPELVDMQFRYRNRVTAVDSSKTFLVHPIRKGQWHGVHVKLTPRPVGHPQGRGEILVWLDQAPDPVLETTRALNYDASDDARYRFHWGYPLDPETRLEDSFDVRVGIYRPEPLTWIKFWMDGVALSRQPADPGSTP